MTFIGYKPVTKAFLFMTDDNRLVTSVKAAFDEFHFPRGKTSVNSDRLYNDDLYSPINNGQTDQSSTPAPSQGISNDLSSNHGNPPAPPQARQRHDTPDAGGDFDLGPNYPSSSSGPRDFSPDETNPKFKKRSQSPQLEDAYIDGSNQRPSSSPGHPKQVPYTSNETPLDNLQPGPQQSSQTDAPRNLKRRIDTTDEQDFSTR